ncbi:Hypothetical predicted protein, partial [Olea europaea subsp. europaea]
NNEVSITVSNPSPETVHYDRDLSFLTSPTKRQDSLDIPESTGVEITVTEPSPDQDVKQ